MSEFDKAYVPPPSFKFTGPWPALLAFIAIVCAKEALIFDDYLTGHPLTKRQSAKTQKKFLVPYTLVDWAAGKIGDEILIMLEGTCVTRKSLEDWAQAFIKTTSYIRKTVEVDPITLLLEHKFISPRKSGRGYEPNMPNILDFNKKS